MTAKKPRPTVEPATGPITSPDARIGEWTDARLAEYLAEQLCDQLCWMTGCCWYVYERQGRGGRWRTSDDVAAVEIVRGFLRAWLVNETRANASHERTKEILKLQGRNRISALTALLKGRLEHRPEEFDADPDVLNTPSGHIRWTMRGDKCIVEGPLPHDPSLLLTKITGARYVSGARHADWDKALQALPDDDVRLYFLDRMGQACTGHIPPDDKVIVQQGGGDNGKTTVLGGINSALGDYATLIPRSLLIADPKSHPTDLMTLRGARYAYIEELPEEHRLNVNRLKESVGTPWITARGVFKDFVTFKATHSLFVNTNYTPTVVETDHGTWRRLELNRWRVRFRKSYEPLERAGDVRADEGLRARVLGGKGVGEAILTDLVEHARRWYERGFVKPPKLVAEDTREWRAGEDLKMAFWDDMLSADPGSHIWVVDFTTEFNAWLEARNHSPWGDKLIGTRWTESDGLPVKMEKGLVQSEDGVHGTRSRLVTLYKRFGADVEVPYKAWVGVRWQRQEEP